MAAIKSTTFRTSVKYGRNSVTLIANGIVLMIFVAEKSPTLPSV